jgi:predicted nucleotidyltransferase
MLTLETLRREKRAEILHRAETHGCRNVLVFGSVATGENRPDSDIDSLVDLDHGRGLLDLGEYFRIFTICWVSRWTSSKPGVFIPIFGTESCPRPCPL